MYIFIRASLLTGISFYQQDAIAAYANFHQNIKLPTVGTHLTVTGSYVLDQGHCGWAEIHSVTSIIKTP